MDHPLQGMLFGERSLSKVVGVFGQQADAEATARQALRLPMAPSQVRVLTPADAQLSRSDVFGSQLEPESQGIFATMIRSHVATGLAGAALGLLLYAWLLGNGQPMVAGSPVLALIAIVGFAITFGLLAGGVVTLRPDHVRVISATRAALRRRQWAVVLHPTDARQKQRAKALMADSGAHVLSTL